MSRFTSSIAVGGAIHPQEYAMDEVERKKFFEMMREIQSHKNLRLRFVAHARKMAADPAWCAKRAAELRKRAKS